MGDNHTHPTGDEALTRLSNVNNPVGSLVRVFPGRSVEDDTDWLDTWFLDKVEQHFDGTIDADNPMNLDLPQVQPQAVPTGPPVRLVSLQVQYFRGFLEASDPVNLNDNLVVIEGPNSSGKTSLAEALEWLFTGSLSRREDSNNGNPSELEGCIQNQFRPDGAETWVKGEFVAGSTETDAEVFTLRRVLIRDYGRTVKSTSASVLYLDDQELDDVGEQNVLDKYFAGTPPLLMQHTIRDFVHADPNRRRAYFERLLQLDQLTELIRLSVVSDEGLTDFPSPLGTRFASMWTELGSNLRSEQSRQAYNRSLPNSQPVTAERITDALAGVAKTEFPAVADALDQDEKMIVALRTEQAKVRENTFPMLGRLRPKQILADEPYEGISADAAKSISQQLREDWVTYEPALLAIQVLGDSNLAVARAFKILAAAQMIKHETDAQTCPMCEYETVDTLSSARVNTIVSWDPIRETEQNARHGLERTASSLIALVSRTVTLYEDLLPSPPTESEWETALTDVGEHVRASVNDLRAVTQGEEDLATAVNNARSLIAEGIPTLAKTEQCEAFITRCGYVLDGMSNIRVVGRSYADAMVTLEAAVGVEASIDPDYHLREKFILCDENAIEIFESLKWERSRRSAQRDLEGIRTALMTYRQQFLESRRLSFSTNIGKVWGALRKDRYSSFSHINIPLPRGKGFPVSFELKANLDDAETQFQVDVLRIFSESQVNALGVAAFVTRSKLLGHKMLVLDDPVQSMDEDHFKTFARDLISEVLDDGFQIVLLTHNDAFARDVSHYHYGRPDYVTMSVRHSRKDGSVVTEGSRRVAERLKLAEHMTDAGNPSEAWRYIRLAVERLYTVTYMKYGPTNFNPESWQYQAAEYMWNAGVDNIVKDRLPDSSDRFKDILDMTVGGAHDTKPRGETDIRDSVAFLRSALNDLRVGG